MNVMNVMNVTIVMRDGRDECKIGELTTEFTALTERSRREHLHFQFSILHFPFSKAGSGVFLTSAPRSFRWVQIKNQKSLIDIRYSVHPLHFSIPPAPPTPKGAGHPRKMQRCGVRYSKEGRPFAIESAKSTKFVSGNPQNFLNLPRAVSKASTGENMLFDNTFSNIASPTTSATP